MKKDLIPNSNKVTLNGEEVERKVVENLKESTANDKNTTIIETGKDTFAQRIHD